MTILDDILATKRDEVTVLRHPQTRDLLRQTAHLSAGEIGARISAEMKDWIRDAEQYDDLTFIVMKVRSSRSSDRDTE